MKILIIILLAAVAITLFALIGYGCRLLLDKKSRLNCDYLVSCTQDFCLKNLGPVRVIDGPIRSGKTTCASGLTHLDELNIIEQINEDLTGVREIMHDINFEGINQDIEEQHELTHDRFLTFKIIAKKYADELDGKEYDNHLKSISYYQLLEKYIYAYFRMLDGNYVMSNIDKYSYITNTWSKKFDNQYLMIKRLTEYVENSNNSSSDETKVKTKYPILRYSVLFEDEKLVNSIKLSTSSAFNTAEDDGTDLWMRLLGHLGKERIIYNTTAQNFARWVKNEREIVTSIIHINDREIIGDLPTVSKRLRKKIHRIDKKMMKYAKKNFKKDEASINSYLLNNNEFKEKHMDIKDKLNKIFSESYVKYSCTIYNKIQDVGKRAEECNGKNFDFVFPIKWCFGSVDSHYFAFLQDYLEGYGKSPYYDLKESISDSSAERAKSLLTPLSSKKDKASKNKAAESKM